MNITDRGSVCQGSLQATETLVQTFAVDKIIHLNLWTVHRNISPLGKVIFIPSL